MITLEDMAGYQSIIREDEDVITVSLQGGRHICGPPPPAGAAVAMGILNALDGYGEERGRGKRKEIIVDTNTI